MNNLSFYDTHVKICIESSKTDIYRQGNTVLSQKQILILVQSSYWHIIVKLLIWELTTTNTSSVLYNLIKI
jgi:hypothetical protein